MDNAKDNCKLDDMCISQANDVHNCGMKKFFRIAISVLCVIVLLIAMHKEMPLSAQQVMQKNLPSDAKYAVYCRQTKLPHTSVGFGCIVESCGDLQKVLQNCKQIDGISCSYIAGKSEVEKLAMQFELKNTTMQNLGNIVLLCGYSPLINSSINIDGKKINVQIAYSDNTITVGSPLILGEY